MAERIKQTISRRIETARHKAAEQVAGNVAALVVEAFERGDQGLFAVDLFRKKLGKGASWLALAAMSREDYARRVGTALRENHGISPIIHSVYSYGGDSTSEDVGTDVVVDLTDPASGIIYPHAANSRWQGRLVRDVLDIYYPPNYEPSVDEAYPAEGNGW